MRSTSFILQWIVKWSSDFRRRYKIAEKYWLVESQSKAKQAADCENIILKEFVSIWMISGPKERLYIGRLPQNQSQIFAKQWSETGIEKHMKPSRWLLMTYLTYGVCQFMLKQLICDKQVWNKILNPGLFFCFVHFFLQSLKCYVYTCILKRSFEFHCTLHPSQHVHVGHIK